MSATQRWRLVIAYDGAGFHGFATQPEVPTVAGALGLALARLARLDEPPAITCAGRTDAGVHARGQVIHVDLPAVLPKSHKKGPGEAMTPADLTRSLNKKLAPRIVVQSAQPVEDTFDARRQAIGRHYRYLVWNAPAPDPLLAPLAWHIADPLEIRRLAAASDVLLGEHDFRSFCRRAPGTSPEDPIHRRVTRAGWSIQEDADVADSGAGRLLRFDIVADSFCHQMVRSLVATLVDVGRGEQNAASVLELLEAQDRSGAADPAPAHGLCLVSVAYPNGVGDRSVSPS
jgi:tRNA pseudouridine38-40 synthase